MKLETFFEKFNQIAATRAALKQELHHALCQTN